MKKIVIFVIVCLIPAALQVLSFSEPAEAVSEVISKEENPAADETGNEVTRQFIPELSTPEKVVIKFFQGGKEIATQSVKVLMAGNVPYFETIETEGKIPDGIVKEYFPDNPDYYAEYTYKNASLIESMGSQRLRQVPKCMK